MLLEEFLKKAKELFGDKYDYSLVKSCKSHEIISIICPKHGILKKTTKDFLKATSGCNKCRIEENRKDFFKKCDQKNQDKFDFEKIKFMKDLRRIEVFCPKHGYFKISKINFRIGIDCPYCIKEKNKKEIEQKKLNNKLKKLKEIEEEKINKRKKFGLIFENKQIIYNFENNTAEFECPQHGIFYKKISFSNNRIFCRKCHYEKRNLILKKELQEKISNDYNYKILEVDSENNNVTLKCNQHGIFKNLISKVNQLCPKCMKVIKSEKLSSYAISFSKQELLEKFKNIHNNFYEYFLEDNKKYKNNDKIKILCKEHGEFLQRVGYHLKGCGCKKCAFKDLNRKTQEQFLEMSKKVHGDRYDYSLVEYHNSHDKVKIICKQHGAFEQIAYNHYQGCNCPRCAAYGSKVEIGILKFIREIYKGKIIEKDRSNIFELDIVLPELNIAFEINGLYWHNELKHESDFHLNKTRVCESQNIQLIHIYEDDWLKKKEIVKSMISSIINKNYFVKLDNLEIKYINEDLKKEFLSKNYLYGDQESKYYLGLFYNEELVYICGFNIIEDSLEISFACNKINFFILDSFKKVLEKIINDFSNIKNIIFILQRDWNYINNNICLENNFKLNKEKDPDFFYCFKYRRVKKEILFEYLKNRFKISEENFDKEFLLKYRYYKIFNSGSLEYIKEIRG